jgi:hypothetical protein
MFEHQYLVNRVNYRRPLPWSTIIKLVIVAAVFLWMQHRDQAHADEIKVHTEEIKGLANIVVMQGKVIRGMECGPVIDMRSPL